MFYGPSPSPARVLNSLRVIKYSTQLLQVTLTLLLLLFALPVVVLSSFAFSEPVGRIRNILCCSCLQMDDTVKAVGNCSYNQLVEKIISCKQSDNSELAGEGESFLFTPCGLRDPPPPFLNPPLPSPLIPAPLLSSWRWRKAETKSCSLGSGSSSSVGHSLLVIYLGDCPVQRHSVQSHRLSMRHVT